MGCYCWQWLAFRTAISAERYIAVHHSSIVQFVSLTMGFCFFKIWENLQQSSWTVTAVAPTLWFLYLDAASLIGWACQTAKELSFRSQQFERAIMQAASWNIQVPVHEHVQILIIILYQNSFIYSIVQFMLYFTVQRFWAALCWNWRLIINKLLM